MRREYQMMIGQKPWESMHRISGYLIGYYEEKNSNMLVFGEISSKFGSFLRRVFALLCR